MHFDKLRAIAVTGAVVAGMGLGVATQALQGSLGGSSAVLANSGAVWVFVAFVLGLVMPTSHVAAVGGATCLVAASISYYVAVDVFERISSAPRGAIVWSMAGIVAGSAFGFAGFVARHNQEQRHSAWGLLAGVVVGEGIHLTWYVGNKALRPAGIAELAVAGIIVILALCRARSAVVVAAITASAALTTLLATSLINRAFVSF